MTKKELLEKHQAERNKLLEYTRVMGYMRPSESFNMGKKGEYAERIFFNTGCPCGK